MSYEVQDPFGGCAAGPFVVLDSAIHAAIKMTRPPPAPPKQYTHVARISGTTDEDPYGLCPPPPPRTVRVQVIERGEYRARPRTRAFVEDGRVQWAVPCKECKGTGVKERVTPVAPGIGAWAAPPPPMPMCGGCMGTGVTGDKSTVY